MRPSRQGGAVPFGTLRLLPAPTIGSDGEGNTFATAPEGFAPDRWQAYNTVHGSTPEAPEQDTVTNDNPYLLDDSNDNAGWHARYFVNGQASPWS